MRNLSAGGALLISGPKLPPGTRCRLLLRGAGVEDLSVRAETLRFGPIAGDTGVALEFRDNDAETLAAVRRVVANALDLATQPGVLVVDHDVATLAALAGDLFAIGRRALLALTPLEAVRWLCDAETRVQAALVGGAGRAGAGPDLLAFVADEFPSIHRVLVYCDISPGELLAALEESNARSLLRSPWSRSELEAALQRGPESRRFSSPGLLNRAS